MKTEKIIDQSWAYTNPINTVVDFRDGFHTHCDCAAIDAPVFIASGCTKENIVAPFIYDGREISPAKRGIIGGLTVRGM